MSLYTFSDAARKHGLPLKVIDRLMALRALSRGMSPDPGDELFLERYARTWRDFELLRVQLARLSRPKREILARGDLTPAERHVLGRYVHLYRATPPGAPLPPILGQILSELRGFYGMRDTAATRRMVARMRRRAYELAGKGGTAAGAPPRGCMARHGSFPSPASAPEAASRPV